MRDSKGRFTLGSEPYNQKQTNKVYCPCGKITIVPNYRLKTAKYCSTRCSNIFRKYRRSEPPSIWTYRKHALKLFPHECNHCGTKKKFLEVDHIDKNRDNNPADGSNWQLLCKKCHVAKDELWWQQKGYSSLTEAIANV